MKTSVLLLIQFFLIIFNINCNQSPNQINKDKNLISLNQTEAQFSHDGQEIVFKGVYDSIYAVHFIDISGNYLGYILSNNGFLSSPTWSSDDKKIAISIEGDLYTVLIHGDSLTKLTYSQEDFSCNWSPDGKYIAYTKSICDPDCGIAIFDLSTKKQKVIGQYGGYASWNDNSNKIYYYHTLYTKISNTDKNQYQGFVFNRVDVNTFNIDSLFFIPEQGIHLWLEACTVSPNGNDILFAASYGSHPVINIWKIDLINKLVIQLTYEGGDYPAFSPSGDKIVYTNSNINEGGLWIMNSDGSSKKRLTKLRE